MAEKISIPTTDNPTRGQSSLTGNVRFRNISGVEDAGYITIGTVTKVFYDKGTLDFSLGGVGDYNSLENISGSGSAPIPVDFWGYNSNNKPFGHYRSVKSGDKVAIAFIDGKVAKPIVIGVYPSDEASYELINPVGYDTADDSSQEVENDVLGDKKVYSNQQIFYRSGAGDILRTLNGHSFMEISDNTEDFLSDIQHNYDSLAGVMLQNGTEVNPETETAQAWLLVHEDNPEADDGDTHRTRFYVNKQGAFQLVFMDTSDESTPVSILEGSKDNGFTLTKRYDNNVLDENSTDYVTLNVGDKDTKSFMVEAASEVDSKAQSSTLEVNSSGIFVNGQNLIDYINSVAKVSQDDINKAIPNSPDFQKLKDDTEAAGKAAADAAEQAKQAGEDAKQAGINAEQAGEDAKAQAQDIKDKIIYYTSISPEQDVYVPGKYLIVNTDTYIADGTIKNAYIEDASIDHAKIASEAVGESQIEDLAVTRAKIANLAVGSAQIEDLAVTDEKVGTLSFDHMIGSTLDATQINVVNLSGDSINAGTITADRLIIRSLGDITDDLGKIHNGEINVNPDPDNPNSGGGVDINGLPADNPDSYTPYKKSLLKSQIAVLEAQADAAISYGQATNNDSTAVSTAKTNLLNGTATLLTDMNTTTKFDHTQIDGWVTALQTAISNFQNASLNTINASIGTTADGKNSISMGTQEPANPHVGDLFLKKQTDGTYDLEIYTENGWVSPALQAIQNVANQVAKLPKSYYTPDQPAGTDYNDGDKWYKNSTDKDGNIVYTEYKWDATKKQWIPMMNNGEVDNADQIAQIQKSSVSSNMLIDSNASSLTKVSGPADRYFSASPSGMTHKYVTITDGPLSMITSVVQTTLASGTAVNSGGGLCFYGNGIGVGMVDGETYTMSMYARILSGATNLSVRFEYGSSKFVDSTTPVTSTSWTKVSWTFKYNDSSAGGNARAYFEAITPNSGTAGTGSIQYCGFKLEKGSAATDYTLNSADLVSTSGNYAGVAINDKGITALAGSSSIYLSNTHGFEIQKSGSDIFHVDTSGNLTMQGDITAGNISGVNFTGNNSTLAGTLAVTGAISAAGGNVVLSSSGLAIKGGNLTIADSSGNTTTYVQADGTFVTKKGIFSGSVTSNNVTITGGDINMNGGKFHVDSSGNVTANSFTSTNSSISNGTITQSTIKIHNADNSFTATLGEISSDYWGFQLTANGNQTWIDMNGIHNSDGNGNDTYIKNGLISTNEIDAISKLHIGNISTDPREIWGADIDVNGLGFTVPVKGAGSTTNNPSDFKSEVQGFIGGNGWNYKTNTVKGTGASGIVIGLATVQQWGDPYGGDFIGIGQFNPSNDVPKADAGNISSADFQAAIQFNATNYTNSAFPAWSVAIAPPLYLVDGTITTTSGNINIKPAASLGLYGNYIMVQSTGSVHLQAQGSGRVYFGMAGKEISTDGGSFWKNGDYYFRLNDSSLAILHAASFSQSSLLSLKTNISKIDPQTALDKINQTNEYTYQYKSDVARGSAKKYGSFIIDDVNDVSQYTEPEEFLSADKTGRDDGTQLAYLTAAVQYLAQRVQQLEADVNSKGEK